MKFFAKVLADGTTGQFVDLRLSAVRQADFFVKLFWIKKVLADGTIGLLVDFRKGGESPVKFLPSFFSKKRVFGYFFQKVTLLIKTSLFCS